MFSPSLQDMPSISVAVRIRPFSPQELQPPSELDQFYQPVHTVQPLDETVLIFDPIHKSQPDENRLARLATSKRYKKDIKYAFDRVFDMKTSQQQIFSSLCEPLLKDVIDGYHATIFAYGATGAGITHSHRENLHHKWSQGGPWNCVFVYAIFI
eukprot:NODE_142_length_15935_cov_1.439126.p13 type:complete len:154 gc:universal NODE_142_length_15935_cov_1.439126:1986-1525(-)